MSRATKDVEFYCASFDLYEKFAGVRAPKTDENYLLIFIFVDPFSKSLVDFLFLLIFQQISTNKQIQQKQINK